MIINACPHEINVYKDNILVKTYPKTDILVRVSVNSKLVGEIDGCPLFENEYGDIEGLPPQADGVFYIVSARVADTNSKSGHLRNDLLVPGSQLRNEKGEILGCCGLVKG